MTNNLNIDVSKGKLDQKEKGSLLPIECKSIEETRRYNLERLASGFRMFAHFGFDEGITGLGVFDNLPVNPDLYRSITYSSYNVTS